MGDMPVSETHPKRFMSTADAAEELGVSENQIRALLNTGELRGFRVGGRKIWRIGTADLEEYIAEAYARTRAHIAAGAPSTPDDQTEGQT